MVRPGQVFAALSAAVRNPDIRRVELAWGAAITAEWAHFVALGVFAYEQGGASAVGIAGLVRLLPAAVVAPFAASLGDRFRRERESACQPCCHVRKRVSAPLRRFFLLNGGGGNRTRARFL